MAEQLTEKLVKALPSPTKGNRLIYDEAVKGFAVRITAAGTKSFVVNYYIHGRERRYTIGSHPDWSVAQAREEAKYIKKQVDQGGDPSALEAHQTRSISLRYDLTTSSALKVQLDFQRDRSGPNWGIAQNSMAPTGMDPPYGNAKLLTVTYDVVF